MISGTTTVDDASAGRPENGYRECDDDVDVVQLLSDMVLEV